MNRSDRLPEQVVELERLDQIGVPDEATITRFDIGERIDGLRELLAAFLQRAAGAEYGRIRLHDFLHLEANLRRRTRTVGVAEFVESRDGEIARVFRQRAMRGTRLHDRGRVTTRLAAEHHEIEQRIRA